MSRFTINHYYYFNSLLGASSGKGITAFHSESAKLVNIVTFRRAFDASTLFNKQLTKCNFTQEAMEEILQQEESGCYLYPEFSYLRLFNKTKIYILKSCLSSQNKLFIIYMKLNQIKDF